MAQGGVKFAQPLQMAAGSDDAAGKLPVAMISSLLDTVVVTRHAWVPALCTPTYILVRLSLRLLTLW